MTYKAVAFLTIGSWALFAPATETLQADSRGVLYCPEDERLTFEGWVVVVKNSNSPRQSPNTNGFNNHNEVQWSNPVVETSAGEPLISMLKGSARPGWCRKNPPVCEAPNLVISKSATAVVPNLEYEPRHLGVREKN